MTLRTFSNRLVVLAILLTAMAGNSDARGFGGGLGRGGEERAGDALGESFGPATGLEPREGNAAGQALPNNVPVEPAQRVLPPSIESVPAANVGAAIENVPAGNAGAAIENVPAANVQAQDGVQVGANSGEQGGANDGANSGVQVAPVAPQSWKTTAARNRAAAAVTSTLPCAPQVIDTGSATYFVCGDVYYEQNYGPNGAIYTPVSGE